jgi:DNA-binding NarL/FixJ family response regulator
MENKAVFFDAITDQVIERELTEEELSEIQLSNQTQQLEEEAKAQARTSALAKLAALGLTEEEIAAL